jgi:hypothetical protein
MAKLALVEKAEAARQEAEEVRNRFQELYAKARSKDASAADMRAFERHLDEFAGMELWRDLPGIMSGAAALVLTSARKLGVSEAQTTVWTYKLRELREEMGHAEDGGAERALVEHVGVCWLRLALAEIHLSAAYSQSENIKVIEFYERRLTAAQKRFTRAVETLAKVRRLASRAPLFQVNIETPPA